MTPGDDRDAAAGASPKRPTISDEELVAQWDSILTATGATHRQVLKSIEDSGVPAAWFAVLHSLLRSDGHRLPMNRLARELSMTSGGFTKLADRMARAGLIDRRNSSGDRRVVYATLTGAGLDAARRTLGQYQSSVREHVLGWLTVAQLDSMTAVMQRLYAAHFPASAAQVDEELTDEENTVEIDEPRGPDRRKR